MFKVGDYVKVNPDRLISFVGVYGHIEDIQNNMAFIPVVRSCPKTKFFYLIRKHNRIQGVWIEIENLVPYTEKFPEFLPKYIAYMNKRGVTLQTMNDAPDAYLADQRRWVRNRRTQTRIRADRGTAIPGNLLSSVAPTFVPTEWIYPSQPDTLYTPPTNASNQISITTSGTFTVSGGDYIE